MKQIITTIKTGLALGLFALTTTLSYGQTTVYDVIAASPNHTSLTAALDQEGLNTVLDNNMATFTVFAPDNAAFDDLAAALGTDIAGLLANPALSDILTYHVLGASVQSSAISNGDIANPLNTANTLKLTVTSGSNVFVNQAQVNAADLPGSNGFVHSVDAVLLPVETVADVAIDNGFTTLVTAVIQEELLPALTDPLAQLTVFAPDNAAFSAFAAELGTDINGLLGSPDLQDILLYHVLGAEVLSTGLTNGQLADALNTAVPVKMTVTGGGSVFANQAQVITPDVTADNGVVHVIDDVILPVTTVADVALGSPDHTSLVTAVVQEELLPVLTDPLIAQTVFAPTNTAFDNLATALGTDINGILALPNLADVLTYHVFLGGSVQSGDLANGQIVTPVSNTNTLKVTVTTGGDVFINQAQVTTPDVPAVNGTVHILDAVVLPVSTVADVALGSVDHTSLVTAVVQERLLPSLTDPLASLTVFAPTNTAFDNLATALGTDLAGVLANPELTDILLYHVLGSEVVSSALTNGPVATLNGQDIVVDLSMGVMINDANVTTPDLTSDNGVVHVIDAVLVPSLASIVDNQIIDVNLYPNPTNGVINVKGENIINVVVRDLTGKIVLDANNTQNIDLTGLENGTYMITVVGTTGTVTKSIQLLSGK